MPIGGGEAKPLTSGIAWDMQPRYSPNGKWIAFTSDRGGGDNIWIMNRDGSKPQAGDEGDVPPAEQPTWSPDSEYIVARKHFTAERSLGAGEMWLYHRSGGERLADDEEAHRPEGHRRAGVLARRPLPLLQRTTSRPARSSNTTRTPTRRSTSSSASTAQTGEIEPLRHRSGRLGPSDAVAGRQVARVRPPRALQDRRSSCRTCESGQETAAVRRPRSRHAGDVGRPRRLPDAWPGRRTASRSSSGPAARSSRVDVAVASGDAASRST